MEKGWEIRQFNIKEASWQADRNILSNLRRLVFIVEQNVPQEEEWDGQDEDAWHWLATDLKDSPIGTARLLKSGQIGRMAVLGEYRGLKIGAALLEQAVEKARHLGFESVFLNAQSHALDFYRKGGFEREGDEFLEAGIKHFRMTQQLTPVQSATQRKIATGVELDVSLRLFDTAEIDWASQGKVIRSLRRTILVQELGLAAETVSDEDDLNAIHFCARTAEGQIIGVLRMSLDGKVSRLAVDPAFRRRGTGFALLEAAYGKAQRFGLKEIFLQDNYSLDNFYTRAGFVSRKNPLEPQKELSEYFRLISYQDVYERQRTSFSGSSYHQDGEAEYILGENSQLLLLRQENEFQQVIIEMCKQARQSIRIHSPLLDHKLFDHEALREICSELARRNRYTKIEILLYDSHRVIKNGHQLLEICRKLPSSITMKIVHPELRSTNHEYVLIDDKGVIYRQDHELYEGYANFRDITDNNRLGRQFRASWESGLADPNLRQIKI